MISVRVNYSPRLTDAEKRLIALPSRLANLRPLMQLGIAPVANAMLERHWATQGAAFGHQWAPWAPSTLAARIRKGNAAKGLLRDTDHLFNAVFRQRLQDNRLRVVAGGLRLQLNVSVAYAIFLQVGTQFMPERQVIPIPLPRSFADRVRKIIARYLITGNPRGG